MFIFLELKLFIAGKLSLAYTCTFEHVFVKKDYQISCREFETVYILLTQE